MKQYKVELTGATPLIMHRDNVSFCERVKKWQKDPANKKFSTAGDDRSPAWIWLGYVYEHGGNMVLEADSLMAMLRDGGKKCPAPTGRGSMKSQTQSGIVIDEIGWNLLVNGKSVNFNDIKAKLLNETDYEAHERVASENGFELFIKRARVGTSKHVRVRPRFHNWACSGTLTIVDPQITQSMLENILKFAGAYCGIGDWRPSSPESPGQFGRFTVEVKAI